MNKLENLIEAKRLIDRHKPGEFHDSDNFIITPHWHYKYLMVCIHCMSDFGDMDLILEDGVFVLEGIQPTEDQKKVIDRVNEIMKEEV